MVRKFIIHFPETPNENLPPPPPEFAVKTELPDSRSRVRAVLGTLFLTLALTACGGGGGGGVNMAPSAPSGGTDDGTAGGGGGGGVNMTPPTTGSEGTTAPIRSRADAIVEAAGNEPRAGSVTQSSDVGINNVTDDVVKVTVTRSGGELEFEAFYNGQKVVSTHDATQESGIARVLGRPKGTHLYELFERDVSPYNVAEFYRSLSTGDIRESDGTAVLGGDLWVDVYTDYTNDGDTDYLAGGVWVYVPDDVASLADYEYGVFVDGNDPFTQDNLARLTGSADYNGEATGVYVDDKNYFLDARATLTADFGDNSALGTIEGRIYDVTDNGVPIPGNPQLALDKTNIGNSNSGFFKGNTSMTFDGDEYTGKWGGQFYGNGGTNDQPGSVAGTFGGASGDGDRVFMGAFGAHKQP